ncbi:hypothetical protein K8I31_02440 [bacterium]|nr:hypothetical protein [bacterium]
MNGVHSASVPNGFLFSQWLRLSAYTVGAVLVGFLSPGRRVKRLDDSRPAAVQAFFVVFGKAGIAASMGA